MKYRPEIDGLRAIAVLPVILFHAGFKFFSGGYVGVDVFFVISGYLITTLILIEKEAGKFTITNFYERRIRRILPALTVLMLSILPFAYYRMWPKQLEEFSQSLVSVSLFYSNILFWQQTGYFETATDLKPLLHTWSLAVEEQYYLFFPLLIHMTWRFGKRIMLLMLAILGLASLWLAQWASGSYPDFAFYLMPTRLWEILIGSLVAIYLLGRNTAISTKQNSAFLHEQILSILGLCLILYSIVFFDETTPFPSFYTLAPTIGTALIILFSSENTLLRAFLANKFFTGIGLISYSAYLWHQPLFAFARLTSLKAPGNLLMLELSLLSLVLAYLSWKYVESPFRDKARHSRKRIFQLAAAVTMFIVSVGIVGYLNKGFGSRVALNGMTFAQLEQATDRVVGLSAECDSLQPVKECSTSSQPEILIWGDSYAMHLVPGILASNPEAKIIQRTKAACGPIVGMTHTNAKRPIKWGEGCLQFNDSVIEWLKSHTSVHYAVLGSPFTQYFSENNNLLVNHEVMPMDKALVLSYFEETLATLSDMGIRPVVFAPPPAVGEDIGNCLVRNAFSGGDGTGCRIKVSEYKKDEKDMLDFLERIGKKYKVIYMSDYLCDDVYCNAELEGVFIYGKTAHLSRAGSIYLGKKMNFYSLITSK
jgi:peptidoglycan/LPS O-acetylase OafA/YrhL